VNAAAAADSGRDQRRLRVGHTMLGMQLPFGGEAAHEAPLPRVPSNPPPVFHSGEDPVDIPTTGLPPMVVGFMVLGAMLLVAVTGFFVLR
jgi:hypothetical protein